MKEKKVGKDTWHIDGAGRGGGRTASIVTLVFAALVLLLFIACSAIDLPRPEIQPKLENALVYPDNGTWDQTFNYTVNCSYSKKVNITLEVYDLSLLDWRTVEDGTSSKIEDGKWKITWENIRICSDECSGTSRYRFTYNGSVVGEPYFGPRIPFIPPTVEEFKNATANPPSGNWNESFNYSVYVNTNKTVNIRLEVFDICSGEWNKSIKSQFYNNTNKWQRLTWPNLRPFSADCTGAAGYKFIDEISKHESEIYYGPVLINVSGLRGLQGLTGPPGRGGGGGGGGALRRFLEHPDEDPVMLKNFEDLVRKFIILGEKTPQPPKYFNPKVEPGSSWHESFQYSIGVEHPNRAKMWLTLVVYSPGRNKNVTISPTEIIRPWMYDETTNTTKVEWRDVKVFTKEDVKVDDFPKYYIRYNDGKNKGIWGPFTGPELTNSPPVLTNSTVSPEEGRYEMPFEYKVNVTDEDGDDVHVTLYILDPEGKEIYNETRPVKGIEAKVGKIESWIYNEFTEKASKKTFKYYFNATDGIDFNVTEKQDGPYIKFVPPVKLIMPYEPYPNSSNWHDEFTYKARIYNPTTEEVIVSLEVYIPSEGEWKKKYDETIEPTERDLIWSVRPFSVKDFDKVSKYRFTVKGGPLTYGKEEEFYGPAIEDVLIPIL